MVVFDCERMKYPNTGLFVFCDNVAKSLVRHRDRLADKLSFFVPDALKGRWGDEVGYRRVSPLHKLYLPCTADIKVWHSAHQQTAYVPSESVRQILTVHDLNFLYEKPLLKQRKYLDALQKKVRRADRIVAISESTKRDLIDNVDVGGKKIEVIYNGLNQFDGDMVPPETIPEGEFLFSVGTVLPKKNFHVLPALLVGNDYKLIIAGNKSSYADRIMDEARKYGVESRVIITGPVSEPVKFWYIKNCAAFLFPSVAEGFGLPVIEAMYYQKPIFLSDHTSLPEIGGDNAFYFDHNFDPDNMRILFRRGMELCSRGGVDMEKMRLHALSFSWDRTANRYIDIYNSLL